MITPQRLQELDRMTLVIDQMAQEFRVTWHAAALRALSLGLITRDDLDGIRALAKAEAVERVLREG